MGIFDSLNDELNNDSVDDSGNESENNEPLPKFIEMALAIMGKGIPIDAKLLKDPKALKELYEKVILGQEPNPTTPDENDIFRGIMQGLPGTPSDEITEAKNLFSRLMKIARQVDYKGAVDLDGDGKEEAITVTWGHGVSDHTLTIEVYKGNETFATLQPKGIQPNFKVEDIDGDGKLEIVLWGAVDDPKMSQDATDESKPFEGHSEPHLFMVSIYKLTDFGCKFSKEYTSKEKYEPFCEEQPKE